MWSGVGGGGGVGMHDEGVVENFLHPFALDYLQWNFNGDDIQNYDASNIGPGDEVLNEPNEEEAQDDHFESSPEVLYSDMFSIWPCSTLGKNLFLTLTFYGVSIDWCGIVEQ